MRPRPAPGDGGPDDLIRREPNVKSSLGRARGVPGLGKVPIDPESGIEKERQRAPRTQPGVVQDGTRRDRSTTCCSRAGGACASNDIALLNSSRPRLSHPASPTSPTVAASKSEQNTVDSCPRATSMEHLGSHHRRGRAKYRLAKQDGRVVSIVDDDESLRRSLRNLLTSVGFRVATFESPEAFLESADRESTGCLVFDLRMPGMDGLELLQRLAALQAGAVAFLEKPFQSAALLDAVRSAVSSM